jgi:hypothetical protein
MSVKDDPLLHEILQDLHEPIQVLLFSFCSAFETLSDKSRIEGLARRRIEIMACWKG